LTRPLSFDSFMTRPASVFGKPICRLGLASHGATAITPDDVLFAIEQGINFLNWPALAEGESEGDAFSQAIAALGSRRDEVVVCVQFSAARTTDASEELRGVLAMLHTDYVDVVTMYYVERESEWRQLCQAGGTMEYLRSAKRDGVVRRIGVTSHQRPLAAKMARSGLLDCVMVRYNAAHRGAECDVFPTTDELGLPVIAYTATRWAALMGSTPDDPPGFVVPAAPEWYRFVLASPSVAVTLAAPHSRAELVKDLAVLHAGPLTEEEYARLVAHGDRVRRHAGTFA
jgi:aryl-alcohol dehydrogenase-like predicted oxidoreductase